MDLKPGSLDWQSGALNMSYNAPLLGCLQYNCLWGCIKAPSPFMVLCLSLLWGRPVHSFDPLLDVALFNVLPLYPWTSMYVVGSLWFLYQSIYREDQIWMSYEMSDHRSCCRLTNIFMFTTCVLLFLSTSLFVPCCVYYMIFSCDSISFQMHVSCYPHIYLQ